MNVGSILREFDEFSNNKQFRVAVMALETVDWEMPISSPLQSCILPVLRNIRVNNTFRSGVAAWFLSKLLAISSPVNEINTSGIHSEPFN
jgi:hypothetical protein